MSECVFLGFTIKGKKMRWTDKALADFKHRIKSEPGEWIRRRIRRCYWKLWRWARHPRSRTCWLWAEDCGSKSANADLDSPKGRSSATTRPVRLSLKSAIQRGVSSKRYRQMSRTPMINQAISNAWLQEQGLLSVKDLWCKAQVYTGKEEEGRAAGFTYSFLAWTQALRQAACSTIGRRRRSHAQPSVHSME